MPISLPKFLLKPFADTGAKADIPVAADQPAGRAGYDVGFPPINMTPVAAGGIPPFGQDMNGILFDLSKAIQYTQSGVHFPFDSAFATAIGGYPIGAIVSDASDKSILWINGTLNNTAYPTGWTQTGIKQATETILGTAKIATQSQVNAGADDSTIVTPKKLRLGFAISIAPSGYISFPTWLGGLIIQWTTLSSTNSLGPVNGFYYSNATTVAFPLAFPNACLLAVATPVDSIGIEGPTSFSSASKINASFISHNTTLNSVVTSNILIIGY